MIPPDSHDSGLVFYRRVVGLAVAVLLGVLLYRIVRPFLAPLAWAVFLAFLLHPVQQRMRARLGGRENATALVLTLLTLVLFVGPLSVLGGVFAAQARVLVVQAQAWAQRLRIDSFSDLATLPFAQRALGWVEQNVAVSADQLRQWIAAGAQRMLEPLAAMGGQMFLGALGTVASFTVMLFVLFFVLRDGERMADATLRLVPLDEARKTRLLHHMQSVTRAVVFGTVATALLQGLLVGVGFAIAGLPSPVVFAVIAAVLSVVPFGGTALVWGPAAIWLFVDQQVGYGIFLSMWGAAVVGLADNFVKPLLISGRAEVPTLAVFIGVLGGLAAFGLVGLFLGPLVIALAIALLRFADEVLRNGAQ